ncbi:MAG: hypothetical protein ABIP41_05970 [Croceibacterium sp.]
MQRLLAASVIAAALSFTGAPASAQDAAGDKVNTVIIYGNDECPKSLGDQITVCARLDEGERYRIPETLRESSSPANESWSNKVQAFETVGNFGPLSCTPFGAGGELGCTAKNIEAAYAEKRKGAGVNFGQLIAAARAERLSTVDAEAAATQARVEQAEQEYAKRLGREQDRPDTATGTQAQATPARTVDPAKLATPPSQR